MNIKRNLTLAVALGLLAVPALNSNNHKVNADANSNYFNKSTEIMGQEHATQANPYHTPDPDLFLNNNGNHYRLGMGVSQINGQNVSLKDFYNSLTGNNTTDNSSVNNKNNYASGNTQKDNTDTQYSNNKKTLPQTSEFNNQSNRIFTSIVLGATGIGLGAFTFEKDKNQKKLSTINTTPNTSSNNGRNEIDYLLDSIKNGTNKLNNYVSKISNK